MKVIADSHEMTCARMQILLEWRPDNTIRLFLGFDMLDQLLGSVHNVDCIEGMKKLEDQCIDLVFADPPFNIGYKYDKYDDRLEEDHYVEWSSRWMAEVYRILKPAGAFWLAIGDEYAAELKVAAKKLGFQTRNWVVWYYTFGVHCHSKFTRSHAHLFYFVKDASVCKFNFSEVAVPSARQLVYNDKRGNPEGRSPDDTWILRPQDCFSGFQADEDVWYFPRVAGTFKERAGFHGCQMPEQLLGRIIRTCSQEGEVVLDPFSGSSTTVVVAKKLNRQFLSFELSEDYVKMGMKRLSSIEAGDALDGAPEPKASAPATFQRLKKSKPRALTLFDMDLQGDRQKLIDAFLHVHRGFSVERTIVDPVLNAEFQIACDRAEVDGSRRERNEGLLDLQRLGALVGQAHIAQGTELGWNAIDAWLPASEIALQQMCHQHNRTLEELFCEPNLGLEFDRIASRFAPGRSSLEYRWAAIKLRRETIARKNNLVGMVKEMEMLVTRNHTFLEDIDWDQIPTEAGVYCIRDSRASNEVIYVGESGNLRKQLAWLGDAGVRRAWDELGEGELALQWLTCNIEVRLSNKLHLMSQLGSRFNVQFEAEPALA